MKAAQHAVDAAVAALTSEVRRLRDAHGADLGCPYLTWRRQLDRFGLPPAERNEAHRRLLAIHEKALQ